MPAPAIITQAPEPAPGDGRFAFIAHPLDLSSYRDFDPSLGRFSDGELGLLAASWDGLVDPFVAGRMRLTAGTASAYGEFVVVPQTAAILASAPHAETLAQIRQAVTLARNRGARIVGLGGYVSIVTGGGADLADLGVPLTTGNSTPTICAR